MTKEKLRKILKGNEALDIDSIPVEEKKSIHLFYGVWLYHVHYSCLKKVQGGFCVKFADYKTR